MTETSTARPTPASPRVGAEAPVSMAFLAGSLRFGGAERHLAHLLTRLDRHRFAPRLYLTDREGVFLEEVESAGVPVEATGIRSVLTPDGMRGLFRLSRRLRQANVRLVHSYLYGANLIGMGLSVLDASLIHAIGIRQQVLPRPAVFRALFNLFEGPRTHFVSVSRAADRVLADWGVSPDWRHRVANGVAIPPRLEPARRYALRAELGVLDESPLITMTANFHPIKGHLELIEAFAIAVRQPITASATAPGVASARLALIGDGKLIDASRELARVHRVGDRVLFLGHRENVGELLQASDLFVLNSKSEGMSNALLEALAAGLPCIATAVGGNPELVRPEENGVLVPPRDVAPLARELERLLRDADVRRRFGERSLEIARAEYSIETMVARTEEIYDNLLR